MSDEPDADDPAPAVRQPGPVEQAVRADIESGGAPRNTLQQVALMLARVADARPDDAGFTTTALLARELRATALAMTGAADDGNSDALREFMDRMSAPVRDTA